MIEMYLIKESVIKESGGPTIQKLQRLRIDFNDPGDHHYEIEVREGFTPQMLAQQFYNAALAISQQFAPITPKPPI